MTESDYPNQELPNQDLPSEAEFERSSRPLPPRLSLDDIPIQIPGEDEHLYAIQREQLRWAKWSFNVGLPLVVVGTVLATWSIISWGGGPYRNGFRLSSSAIMQVVSFILIRIHRVAAKTLEEAQNEARAARREHIRYLKLLKISDPKKRDEAIARLVEQEQTSPAPRKKTEKSKSRSSRR